MLQNIYISDKCCSSELSIHQRNLNKLHPAINHHNHNYNIYLFLEPNLNIRRISEESCDWSNDDKNSVLKSQELITFKNMFKLQTLILNYKYFQIVLFLLYFG